jgi:hypothetical protein
MVDNGGQPCLESQIVIRVPVFARSRIAIDIIKQKYSFARRKFFFKPFAEVMES